MSKFLDKLQFCYIHTYVLHVSLMKYNFYIGMLFMIKEYDGEESLEEAKKKILEGNYSEARNILEQSAHDEYGHRYYYLGIVYANDKDYEKAESYLYKTLEVNEEHIGAYLSLADIYNDTGRLELSKPLLEKAYGHDPDNANLLSYLVGVYMHFDEFDNALTFARKLYDKSPNDEIANLIIMLLDKISVELIKSGDLDLAESNAQEIISLNEDHQRGYRLMGLIRQTQKNYKSAVDYFIKALQRDQNDLYILNSLTRNLVQVGDGYSAQLSNNKALELYPDDKIANELKKSVENLIKSY